MAQLLSSTDLVSQRPLINNGNVYRMPLVLTCFCIALSLLSQDICLSCLCYFAMISVKDSTRRLTPCDRPPNLPHCSVHSGRSITFADFYPLNPHHHLLRQLISQHTPYVIFLFLASLELSVEGNKTRDSLSYETTVFELWSLLLNLNNQLCCSWFPSLQQEWLQRKD